MENKGINNNLLLILNVVLFLVLTIGHSFAFFEATIEGDETVSKDIFYVEDLQLRTTGLTPVVFYKQPGESVTSTFTVTNTGVKIVKSYTINLSEVYNSFVNKEDVVYTLTCVSSTDTCEGVEQTVFPSESKQILTVTDIDVNEVHTFNLTVTYLENDHETSNINNIQYKITINKVDEIGIVNLANTILTKNGGTELIAARGTPSFGNATTNMGMFAALDTSGTSYYYRGAINDNYVEFADLMWRIVRINGDGSIRIILNDYARNASGTAYSVSYNTNGNCRELGVTNISISNACVAYGNGSYASTSIANNVNAWYKDNISGIYLNYVKEDSTYCNDYSYTGGWAWTGYGPNYRLIDSKAPNLTCTAPSGYANGSALKLTLPVGLLTADELAMAGGYFDAGNSSFYLYIGNTMWWTMSPSHWGDPPSNNSAVMASSSLSLIRQSFGTNGGIRPVINLVDTVIVSGTGSKNDPYRIVYE